MLRSILAFFIGICLPYAAFGDGNFGQLSAILRLKSGYAIGPYRLAEALSDIKNDDVFSPLFEHYTLGKDSLSLQAATPLEPRAILFGNTGKFIITFNGGPHMAGGASLEIAEFDSVQRKIFFREIIFKDEVPQSSQQELLSGLSSDEIEFENDRIAYTRPNPAKCMQCHAMPGHPTLARYVWNSYPLWLRMFGANSDELDKVETKQLAEFKSISNDRYSKLLNSSSNYPYLYPARKALVARPNLFLTKAIAIYQSVQIADMILTNMTEKDRLEFQKGLFRRKPVWPNVVSQSLKNLDINPDQILLIPPDLVPNVGYNLGTPSLFGGYNLDSMIEFQLFKLMYGENVISHLLANLPYRKAADDLYPKVPASYFASSSKETSLFINSNIYFKSIWWNIEPEARRKSLLKAIGSAKRQ